MFRKVLKRVSIVLAGVLCLAVVVAGLLARYPGEATVPAGMERNESLYLEMRDSTKIAVDVWYPEDLEPSQEVPALIRSTRYFRALEPGFGSDVMVGLGLGEDPNADPERDAFNEAGYAVVVVDARGSGASFGSREIEWSPDEVEDLGEVVDWIVSRPWSNGNVGSWGVSYDGNTAELTTVPNRPAVKAVAPLYSDFDPLANLAMPGGVLNRGFVEAWGAGNDALDRNDLCAAAEVSGLGCFLQNLVVPGVKPVDGEEDRLQAAVEAHSDNYDVYETLQGMSYYDDPFGDTGTTVEEISPYGLREPIERSEAAMYVRVGWLDAATVNYAISRYKTFSNPQRLEIGPWNHGGDENADPFLPSNTPTEPSVEEQTRQLIEFFDAYLKDGEPTDAESRISYYTMNGGGWKTTEEWPPPGFENRRMYFGPQGSLTEEEPEDSSATDEYEVDFSATTGDATRWDTSLGGDVVYPDRSEEDEKLLTYTSGPMPSDVEITGTPVVTLKVSSTATDGAFHVYLEDVAPDGRVTYVTEGVLRALHRKVSDEEPPYQQFGPYHSFEREDGEPLVPGEVAEMEFALSATSVRIEEGHRLRVAIAGQDASTFERIPERGTPTITVHRNTENASSIELPIREIP